MPTVISPIIITALLAGIGADGAGINAAHNTTVKLTCNDQNDDGYYPVWYMNGSADGYRSSRNEDTGELVGTLIVNGSHICGIFSVHCRLYSGQTVHNTILTVEGPLPAPEDIHINESLVIQWNPPYSAINNESNFMHVDPYITQYTVYTIDNCTGNRINKVNVTETSFRRTTTDDHSCPMYRVTAWNSGGEGNMSAPLPGYRSCIPNSIAAEDVDIHREPGALDIRLNVTDPCTLRIPNTFLVTVMSADGVTIPSVQYSNTTIHIALPQNVDKCNLIVRISAGNSAGMSSPTEIIVGCQTTGHSTATTTTTVTTTTSTGSTTDLSGQNQQGDNSMIYIATAVGAVVIVAAVALLLIILWKCKRNTKAEKGEVVVHHNQSYETVTRMNHFKPETKVPTEPCPAYGVVGAYHM